jgi:hypothetical protein
MRHPLEAFASSISLDTSRVINFPSFLLLCGGPIGPADESGPSLRALFYQRLTEEFPALSKRVRLSEEANAWSKTAEHYVNLIELESDIAGLSAMILLFVESADSIAELGAFSQVPPLREKLVAVLERSHQEDDSFIQNGPVALMRSYNVGSVVFHPWLSSKCERETRRLDKVAAAETVDRLLKWLSEYMTGLAKEEKFHINDHAHRLLLIADSVNLGTIMLQREIMASMHAFGVTLTTEDLEKCLFLLEKLQLVAETQYRNNTYYYYCVTKYDMLIS